MDLEQDLTAPAVRTRTRGLPAFAGLWGEQVEPTPTPIYALHGPGHGLVGITRIYEGRWQDWRTLGALDPREPVFDAFLREILAQDAYATMNGLNRPRDERRSELTGLVITPRRSDNVGWLNACWVDVDAYRCGLTALEAMHQTMIAVDDGLLPEPTIYIRSGRGCWPIWAIEPVARTPETLRRYLRVQHWLAARLQPLGADPKSIGVEHVAPFPGSLKSALNTRVQWLAAGRLWTLDKLAAATVAETDAPLVVLDAPALPAPVRAPRVTDDQLTAGQRSWLTRWIRIRDDLHALIAARGGGFDQGTRNRGCFYLALAHFRIYWAEPSLSAKGAALADAAVWSTVWEFAQHCRPVLSLKETTAAVRMAARNPRILFGANAPRCAITRDRLWADLHVTDVEKTYLATFRPSRQERTTTQRREAIREIVAALGRVPSTRAMTRLLHDNGFTTSPMTTKTDYDFIFPLRHVSRGGRPRKETR